MDADRTIALKAQQDIPIGHKLALKDIKNGDTVIKYGHDIGRATATSRRVRTPTFINIKTKRW